MLRLFAFISYYYTWEMRGSTYPSSSDEGLNIAAGNILPCVLSDSWRSDGHRKIKIIASRYSEQWANLINDLILLKCLITLNQKMYDVLIPDS